MKLMKSVLGALAFVGALAACSTDTTGPSDKNSVAIFSGDGQFATRSGTLGEPLQVIVTDPVSKKPRADVQVEWKVVQGTGAFLTLATSTTNDQGLALTQLRLGDQLGTYAVEATPKNITGSSAKFTARAVDAPAITSVTPTTPRAGDTVTIAGQNFSINADDNVVSFGGFRAKITSASTTQLRAIVPQCVPTRGVAVKAAIGAVAGNAVNVSVTGTGVSALQLARGEVRTIIDANQLACIRLPGGVTGMSYLIVPQSFSEIPSSVLPVQLAGLTESGVTSLQKVQAQLATRSRNEDWELRLRLRERTLAQAPGAVLRPELSVTAAACSANAQVGTRCDFQVINKNDQFEKVTAEVKGVSARAIIFQDVKAPTTGAFTPADFQTLGSVFDDPIYATDVATWGVPSDIDANGKIIILLTPVVNALTDRGSAGFIAGFFYGCDLLNKSACSGSNGAEIFYALTPDLSGQFSDARTRDVVMRALPPVLAHEFQHMINFGARANSTDDLWLSEGMAHHAEDVVGEVFEQRGDLQNADLFTRQNYTRGNRYLRATAGISLVSDEEVGSLELRGAAWLFVKYLAGRFGNTVLAAMTRSTQSGVANVRAATGKLWNELLSDWGVALWADNSPDLAGATVDPRYTFPNINLRTKLANTDGSYPLKPTVYNFQDFIQGGTVAASSQMYVMLTGGAAPPQLSLTFGGQFGGAFPLNASPQLSILRVR